MKPFTRIRGNVKGEFDDRLGPCTFWAGPNQAGKSSRLIAARYALCGASGWTSGAHGSDIAPLAPPGADQVYASLDGPDGDSTFEVVMSKGKWRDPKPPSGSLPLTEEQRKSLFPLAGRSPLTLGGTLGPRELASRFGRDCAEVTPAELLPEQAAAWQAERARLISAAIKERAPTPTAVELLVGMAEAFGRAKLALGRQLTAAKKDLDARLGSGDATGTEQLPALQALLDRCRVWESGQRVRARQLALVGDKERYSQQATAYDTLVVSVPVPTPVPAVLDSVEAAEAALREAEVALAGLQPQLSFGESIVTLLDRAAGGHAHTAQCFVCMREGFDVAGLRAYHDGWIKDVRARAATQTAVVAAARKRVLAAKASASTAAGTAATNERARRQWEAACQDAHARLQAEYTRICAVEAELEAAQVEGTDPGITSAEVQSRIQAVQARVTAHQMMLEAQRKVRLLQKERDDAASMEKIAKDALREVSAKICAAASQAVTQFLPAGMEAVVSEDGTWHIVTPAGPKDRHALSGREVGMLTIAVARAYAEPDAPCFLALDDQDFAGLGTENSLSFFKELAASQARGEVVQVFAAGVRFEAILDDLEAVPGWVVHRLPGR